MKLVVIRNTIFCLALMFIFSSAAQAQQQSKVADFMFERAQRYYQRGDYQQALREFEKVLLVAPEHAKALMHIKIIEDEMVAGVVDQYEYAEEADDFGAAVKREQALGQALAEAEAKVTAEVEAEVEVDKKQLDQEIAFLEEEVLRFEERMTEKQAVENARLAAKAKAKAEARAEAEKARLTAKVKAEAEAKAKAKAERAAAKKAKLAAKAKTEAQAKARAEAEKARLAAKAKAGAEAKAKAEAEARLDLFLQLFRRFFIPFFRTLFLHSSFLQLEPIRITGLFSVIRLLA